jgi:hypothetical protein
MKTRIFTDRNYKAVFHDGKTLRMAIDPKKPIPELDYPEFYDISLSTYCDGECPYCYQNNSRAGHAVEDPCGRLTEFFGPMTVNQRPFQVALSGLEYVKDPEGVLKTLTGLGIVPNYTTNGLNVSDGLVRITGKYCGGVAVTAHRHLDWHPAVNRFLKENIFTNIHVLVHDRESIDYFLPYYTIYKHRGVRFFVFLPMINKGRASGYTVNTDYLFTSIKPLLPDGQIAFGSNFYNDLIDRKLDIYLYQPEIFSSYLNLMTMKVYKSSFSED